MPVSGYAVDPLVTQPLKADRLLQVAVEELFPQGAPRLTRPSLLTQSTLPVEYVISLPSGELSFTADPAPNTTPQLRLKECLEHVKLENEELARTFETLHYWQSCPPLAKTLHSEALHIGAWLGARVQNDAVEYSLYLETPPWAPWKFWDQSWFRHPPVLHQRPLTLQAVSLSNSCQGEIELHYSIPCLSFAEIGQLMRRADLPDSSQEFRRLLEDLYLRSIHREIVSHDLGFAYTFNCQGQATAFTLYSRAKSLLGPERVIREALLQLAARKQWDASAYEAYSRKDCTHGSISLSIRADQPLELAIGCIGPHPPELPS